MLQHALPLFEREQSIIQIKRKQTNKTKKSRVPWDGACLTLAVQGSRAGGYLFLVIRHVLHRIRFVWHILYEAHALRGMPCITGGRVNLQQIAWLAKTVQLLLYRKLT